MQYYPPSTDISVASSNVSIPWNTIVASEKDFVAYVLKTLDKLKQRDTQKTSSDILFAIAATYKVATTTNQGELMLPKFELLNAYVVRKRLE